MEFPTSKEGQEFVDKYRAMKEDERPKLDGNFFVLQLR